MNKEKFLKEEKDCAELLGISLEEYHESLNHVTPPKFQEETQEHKKKSQSILKELGISESLLKKRII